MFDQQLTMDGGAEDLAPAHRQDRLFVPVKVMKGQTSIALGCNYCERPDATINDLTGRCTSGTGCNVACSERIRHGVA